MSKLPSTLVGFNKLNDSNFLIVEKAPVEVKDDIKKLTERVTSDFSAYPTYNFQLAGQIEKEYEVEYPDSFISFLNKTLTNYDNQIRELYVDSSIDGIPMSNWQMGSKEEAADWNKRRGWVNFQGKGEYNPPHIHAGHFSFVYWDKIPFNTNSEFKAGFSYKTSHEVNQNGCIYFQFPKDDTKVESLILQTNTKWEGHVGIFPNYLMHGVNPFFSSDDYRVSYSGNITLRKPKSLM